MAILNSPVKVKVCGMTQLKDALLAVEHGADAVGFIFYKKSPRSVNMKEVREIISKLPPFVDTVGVFVDENVDRVNKVAEYCGLDLVQLHGEESPSYCRKIKRRVIKAFRVKDIQSIQQLEKYSVSGFLLDTYTENLHGGTGKVFDWNLAHPAKKMGPVILAGGLTPRNIRQAISQARPYGVDVCSGVEKSPGIKDPEKVRAFLNNIKSGSKS
ncbi:MAG: phosphoribosylanthranilate isomerase [Nitrospina sp.]|jgi:phosphoribosylanthranilate isomerase|nr:phosphoribosylanthranilate isomerase [Nitrospina sp.]MBT5633208.1 phosphoribosylanthranilate isomerase [Nitrospina sp.]